VLSWAVVAALAAPARAGIPWCASDPVDRYQLLRRWSLDLRQRAPSPAEYAALAADQGPVEAHADAMLASAEFSAALRAYHRDLLWPSLSNALVFNAIAQLTRAGDRWFNDTDERNVAYRRGPTGTPCADREQHEFDADGAPVPGPDGRDGWVWVEPYWAPGTRLKVCAYEAQPRLTAEETDASGRTWTVPCHVTGGYVSRRCGCGPALAFCNAGPTRGLIRDGFVEQLLRLVDDVVQHDRPYTELLTTRAVEVNGPVSHYLRWQWGFAADVLMVPDWTPPDVPFTEARTWVRAERGPAHAGLLTLPAYLLKFQTNRSRANRFHNAFLCQPFQPPPGGLRLTASSEPDVAKRPGCAYCHQTLEPAAAWWGRFVEQGVTWLDPALYPVEHEACRNRAWDNDPLLRNLCLRAYISGRPPAGVLRAYEFARDGSPEAEQLARHAALGPRGFAEEAIRDGRFAACTTRKWWAHLMRREPASDEERDDLPRLASEFARGGFRLKPLVRAIVTSEAYRRAP
jgi:hypothetical protein